MDFSSRPAVSPSDNHGGGGAGAAERGDRPSSSSEKWEHMFDKVVTPSDVGKLNRLVIPKQHAEKYFPLDSSAAGDKGLLLDFEDRDGKSWRFRYSYWTSSQSYVMTKGWTRFVKAKRLHAGDVVSFHRRGPAAFFIDWRRRPPPPPLPPYNHIQYGLPLHHHHQHQPYRGSLVTGLLGTAAADQATNEPISRHRRSSKYYGGLDPNLLRPQIYIRGQHQMQIQMQLAAPSSSVPSAAAGKRLRLFGVNMDCSEDHDSETSADAATAANDVNVNSTEEDEGSLELRLDGSAPSSMHTTTTTNTRDFLEKGKSSMTLDFDF